MTLLFIYNNENGELFCSQEYDGGEIPKNGTLKQPPETKENETVVFKEGEWHILKDYRFTHKMKKEIDGKLEIKNIEELGEIPDDWELITLAEAETLEEQIRIAGLFMTKYDFYKYVLLPNGLNYNDLLSALSTNIEMRAAWDLCQNVFRGDPLLNKYIKNFITITDEQLNEIFKEHGSEIAKKDETIEDLNTLQGSTGQASL